MRDELTTVLEGMRRAQAKVAFYLEPGNRNPEKAFREIAQILDDRELMQAMQTLYEPMVAPSMSPDVGMGQEDSELSRS